MRFQVLGPIRVDLAGREIALTASRDRILLGVLLVHANRTVSAATLIDVIWPANPPQNARNQLQGCVSRLRKRLAHGGFTGQLVVTEPTGYRAAVDPEDLDLLVFRRLVAEARAAAGDGRYDDARTRYRAALGLWRGPVLADMAPLIASVEEERAQALEECLNCELAVGAGRELVAELTDLVQQHPLREGLYRALMLALYRAGRQADALAAFRRARELLHDELGIEPGHELQRLHQAILNRDPALDASTAAEPAASPPVPRQLPSDVAGFTGRAEALKALDELLGRRSESTGPVVISAIAGTAGIGKTALAVHWGHQAADRFPDGQLYVNLRGFDPAGAPMEPATAVRGFLDALQVPPERVPASVDAQVSLYRSLLVERRMLVVLDNARDADQVRPLLPGSPGCLVLVTSRRRLSGLVATEGAVPLPIDVLPAEEARQMLAARFGRDRVAAEPAAVAELVAGCAGLPLALAIVAARAATRPGFPLSVVAEEVRAAGAGLEPWAGPDAAADLRAVFSWSYEALEPAAARLFRLLGLHPGPDLAVPAAASLAGVPVAAARRLLATLTEASLVIEHTPGRYTLHDLLRAYATELTETIDSEPDRHAAVHRLLDHYLVAAYEASTLIDPHRPPRFAPPEPGPGMVQVELQTREVATAWLTTEEAVLVKVIDRAAEWSFDSHTWRLANCLNVFFDRRGKLSQLLGIQTIGLSAAERLNDPVAQASAHGALGVAHGALGNHDYAHAHLDRALRLRKDLGDSRGEAMVHVNLSWHWYRIGRWSEAMRSAQRAYHLFCTLDDRVWQGRTLNMVAWCYSVTGDHRRAILHGEQALRIHQEIGDTTEEGFTWDSVGYAHHHLGDHHRAIDCFQRALTLFDRHDDRRGRASVLHHLGDAYCAVGEYEAACSAWRAAQEMYEALSDPENDHSATLQAKLDKLQAKRQR